MDGFVNIFNPALQVQQNKNKKMLLTRNGPVADKRCLLISKLPEIVRILDSEFKKESYKPLAQDYLETIICKSAFIKEGKYLLGLSGFTVVARFF